MAVLAHALVVLVVLALPATVVTVLLAIAAWRERARTAALAVQHRVTDAVHRDFGALVAPTVRRGLRGPWTVSMAAPLGRPDVLGGVLATVERAVAQEARGRGGLRIVLTPQEPGGGR